VEWGYWGGAQTRSSGEQCSSPSKLSPVGSGVEPRKIWILGPQKSCQNGMLDNVLFDTAPTSQYVVNAGADNKLNSMDSVLVDIELCGD